MQVMETRKTVLGPEHPDTLTYQKATSCVTHKVTAMGFELRLYLPNCLLPSSMLCACVLQAHIIRKRIACSTIQLSLLVSCSIDVSWIINGKKTKGFDAGGKNRHQLNIIKRLEIHRLSLSCVVYGLYTVESLILQLHQTIYLVLPYGKTRRILCVKCGMTTNANLAANIPPQPQGVGRFCYVSSSIYI